ncbi:MAG: hypothetical protein O3C28_14985 [Proteobacteria bacterium]|nr:hypothetical protein [Pseudomonadota bacterium]
MPTPVDLLKELSPRTFAELDRSAGLPKGSAFRAFKATASLLVEGRDFYCCDSRTDSRHFAEWTASGRFYKGTVNAVLLTDSGQALVLAMLHTNQ